MKTPHDRRTLSSRHLLLFDNHDHCSTAALPLPAPCTLHPASWLSCTKPEIIADGNATVPNAKRIDDEEGEDSGVVSVPQDETVVQHRITLGDLTSTDHLLGEEMSATMFASSAESASMTQGEDVDSADGEILQPFFHSLCSSCMYAVLDLFLPQIVIPHRYRDDTPVYHTIYSGKK